MSRLFCAPVALIFCAAISGCETGGDSDGGSSGATFAEQAALAQELSGEIAPLGATDPGTLRTTGSVNYNGIYSVATDDVVILGDLSLTANFLSDDVTGGLSNVNGSNGVNYSGTVPLTNGAIDTGASLSETVTGDFVGEISDGSETVVLNTSINGDFFGDDEAYIGGDVTGSVTINGDATQLQSGDGAFAVSSDE